MASALHSGPRLPGLNPTTFLRKSRRWVTWSLPRKARQEFLENQFHNDAARQVVTALLLVLVLEEVLEAVWDNAG